MRALFWSILGTLVVVACTASIASAQSGARGQRPQIAVTEGDFVIHDFRFDDGEMLPELSLHYRTLGTLRTDATGHAVNAVYIMHGTTGSGANFLVPQFAGELYGPGQLDTCDLHVLGADLEGFQFAQADLFGGYVKGSLQVG